VTAKAVWWQVLLQTGSNVLLADALHQNTVTPLTALGWLRRSPEAENS